MKNKIKYLTKEQCIRQGFVKTDNGYYKMTVLEKYLAKGWLDLGNTKYSENDRMRAARRFQKDYEQSCFMTAKISSYRERVDSCGKNIEDIEAICKARASYAQALKQVPKEFLEAVYQVCINNKDFESAQAVSERRKLELSFSFKRDVCRGLDYLIKFYWSK